MRGAGDGSTHAVEYSAWPISSTALVPWYGGWGEDSKIQRPSSMPQYIHCLARCRHISRAGDPDRSVPSRHSRSSSFCAHRAGNDVTTAPMPSGRFAVTHRSVPRHHFPRRRRSPVRCICVHHHPFRSSPARFSHSVGNSRSAAMIHHQFNSRRSRSKTTASSIGYISARAMLYPPCPPRMSMTRVVRSRATSGASACATVGRAEAGYVVQGRVNSGPQVGVVLDLVPLTADRLSSLDRSRPCSERRYKRFCQRTKLTIEAEPVDASVSSAKFELAYPSPSRRTRPSASAARRKRLVARGSAPMRRAISSGVRQLAAIASPIPSSAKAISTLVSRKPRRRSIISS